MVLNHKKIPSLFKWIVVGVCVCLLSLGMSNVQAASPFFWDFIDVDLALQENGDLLVSETQKYNFTAPHTNQRYRYIPLTFVDQITDVTVSEAGRLLPIKTGIERGQYWIRWEHSLNTPESHIFQLNYRVIGSIQANEGDSLIYWQALFPERNAPINRSRVTVHLPVQLAGKGSYFSGQGVKAKARKVDPRTIVFEIKRPIRPGQSFSARVRFPAEILNLPMSKWQASHAAIAQDSTTSRGTENSAPRATQTADSEGDKSLLWFLVMIVASTLCSLVFGRWGQQSSWGDRGSSHGSNSYGSSNSYGGGGGGGSGYGGDGGDAGGGGGGGG